MSCLATVFYNGKSELKWFADQNKSALNLRGLIWASSCEFLVSFSSLRNANATYI
jgi:hypothetical protein